MTTPPEPVGRLRAFLASYWTPAGRQALRNLVGLVACTGISQACALGVLLILTHGLSQAAFGAVIFALNVQTYLVAVGTFGLYTIVVRDLTQRPEKADETTTAFLAIVATASTVAGVITAVAVAFAPVSWDERVMLWCVSAGSVFASLNLSPLYDAAHRQALAAALTVPGDVLALGGVLGCHWTGQLTVPVVGLAFLGKWCLTAALLAAVFKRRVSGAGWHFARDRARQMIRAGRPMLWAALIYSIPMSGGVVLVRLLQGDEQTAVYGLAFQLVMAELMLVGLALRVLQPHITGPHGLHPRFLRQLALAVVLGVGGLCFGSLAAGSLLIGRFLPETYAPAYAAFAILQVFVACYALAATANCYLLRFHRERLIPATHVVAVSAYLALIALGAYQYELGFPVATVASAGVLLALSASAAWYARRADVYAPVTS